MNPEYVGGRAFKESNNQVFFRNNPLFNKPLVKKDFMAKSKQEKRTKVERIVESGDTKVLASLMAHDDLGNFVLALEHLEILAKQYEYALHELFIYNSSPSRKTRKRGRSPSRSSRSGSRSRKRRRSTSGQQGGSCTRPIISLQYQMSDTWHDFGGISKNGLFPCDFSPKEFLQESRMFLNFKNLPSVSDALNNYYQNSYAIFEESIKVDYLSGFLNIVYQANQDNVCDDVLPYTSFYFTDKPVTPNTKVLNALNQYREQKQVYTDSKLEDFQKNVVGKYQYFLMDACMSIHKEKNIFKVTKLQSLCNLWDPAATTKLPSGNGIFIDDSEEFNLKLVEEKISIIKGGEYKVYDSKMTENGNKSLYDEVYDPLLNKYSLNDEYKITFKLRLFLIEKKQYIVCIIVYKNARPFHLCKMETGGFSINDLVVGMKYVHDDIEKQIQTSSPISYQCKNTKKKLNLNLKTLLDAIYSNMDSNNNYDSALALADKKKKLKAMLARFKSTGDHGSAETVKQVNQYCGKGKHNTMYLSGDQLCYVYSMMIGNPTLFRYFKIDKKGGEEENEINDETPCGEDACEIERTHFVGFYDPGITEEQKQALIEEQKQRMLSFIQSKNGLDFNGSTMKLSNPDMSPTESIKRATSKIDASIDLSYTNRDEYKKNMIPTIPKITQQLQVAVTKTNSMEKLFKIEKLLHKTHYLQNALSMQQNMKKVVDQVDEMHRFTKMESKRVPKNKLDIVYDKFMEMKTQEKSNMNFREYLIIENKNEEAMSSKKSENNSWLYKLEQLNKGTDKAMEKTLEKIKHTYRQSYGVFKEVAEKMKKKFKNTIKQNLKNSNKEVQNIVIEKFNLDPMSPSKTKTPSKTNKKRGRNSPTRSSATMKSKSRSASLSNDAKRQRNE